MELCPRGDPELGEHLMEVVLHCARADDEPGADLGVRETVASQEGDLGLRRGELIERVGAPGANPFTCREKLALRTLGEGFGTHGCEQLVGCAERRASVDSPAPP